LRLKNQAGEYDDEPGKAQEEVGNEDLHALLQADITIHDEGTSEKTTVWIFRDRVFWPCDKK
jgi:hypothetical protein